MSTGDYDYGETVDRLLADARELTAEADDPDEALGDDDLSSLAAEARDLVEGADPAELLDAVGLDVPEGGGPAGLARAVSDADDDSLVRLRRLQLLASIDRDDGDDREALGEFDALGDATDSDGEGSSDPIEADYVDLDDLDLFGDEIGEKPGDGGETGDGDEEADGGEATDGDGTADEDGESDESEGVVEGAIDAAEDVIGADEEATDGDEEATDGDEEAAEDAPDEDAGAATQVHDALSSMVEEVQEKAPDDSTRDTRDGDEEAVEEGETAEEGEAAEEDDEDGDSSESSGSSTRPPSDRADMRVPPRHSTMPE